MSTSVTETGGPSTATEIEISVMATISGGSRQQFSNRSLINVPDHFRRLNEQAFTPQLISIGPIHHSNAKLQPMKKLKGQFCDCFKKRAKIDLENLLEIIKAREKEIRSYYAETILSSISSADFVAMILVDGMFILEYFLRESNPDLWGNNPKIEDWMPPFLKLDLVLLENQLPFFVLEILFKQANLRTELQLKPLSLRELALEFFECYNFHRMAFEDVNANIQHFTDLVRFFYLSEPLPDRCSGGAKLSYSATQLHEVGVELKGVEFDEKIGRYRGNRRFLDIRFDLNNGVLEIPCIELKDEKVRLIQNIIALEQSLYVGQAYVTDFFVILNFLIDTSRDVDLLCDKGILVNYLGDSNAAASTINSLNTNILWGYMNPEYSKIFGDLNAFSKKRWHKWKATLWRQYFSTPWRAASTSAAIILLVLTAIQTVCTLRSTKW